MGNAAGGPGAGRGRCDVVLVETVGVGQAEVDIASLADSTVVLLAPGMGDGIQAAKAGILEIADLFVGTRPTGTARTRPFATASGMLALASASLGLAPAGADHDRVSRRGC